MSTQSYAPDRQATSQQASGQQVTSQPSTRQQSNGPSWFQIWATVIGTAVLAGLVVGQAAPYQGCFTHPRIALDGYQPRLSRLHPGDYLRQLVAFGRPADENVERCLPVLHAIPPTLLVPSAYS